MGNKIIGVMAFAVFASVALGCGGTELEDKIFPIEIAIDGTENIAENWLSVSSGDGRVVDYDHLKVIVLGRDFLTEEGALDELLDLLEERNDVPRNAWVVAADNATEIIDNLDAAEIGLGDTFERIVKLSGNLSEEAYPTIGDLYKEQENKADLLWLPYMDYSHGELSVDHYYAYSKGKTVCDVDTDSAVASLFAEGKAKYFTVTLDDERYAELTDAKMKKYADEAGNTFVKIKCKGKVYGDKTTNTSSEVQTTEEAIGGYMDSTLMRLARDTGLSVPDSVSVEVKWK